MKMSLRTRLSLSYVFIALLCVFFISLASNLYLEKYFREYVIKTQEKRNDEIVSMIGRQYIEDGKWNYSTIEEVGINALEQGLIISILKNDGSVIWSALEYNSGLCQKMIMDLTHNMVSRYPNWKGAYEERIYPIIVGGAEVGSVKIGYYGPFYFNDIDLSFINTLNRVIFGIGLLSLAVALVLGYIMARKLSIPISKVTKTAEMISKGNFTDKCDVKSSIKEISMLTGTINNLSETLYKQESLRKRLTADVAHELRTPLATLQSHMEAMIDGIWEADVERLKSCHEEIIRLGRLVGDLEKLAKYEKEAIMLKKTEFAIAELVTPILLNYQSEFSAKGIELEYDESSIKICADKDKLRQVLVNLLSNSLKYTQPGGIVKISDRKEDDFVVLAIEDNGQGISEADLPFIFERFYRADESRNRDTGGSGIGLAIARALVEAHGGSISVESELGKGAKFEVFVPC